MAIKKIVAYDFNSFFSLSVIRILFISLLLKELFVFSHCGAHRLNMNEYIDELQIFLGIQE